MSFKKICEKCGKEQKRKPKVPIYTCKCGHKTDLQDLYTFQTKELYPLSGDSKKIKGIWSLKSKPTKP